MEIEVLDIEPTKQKEEKDIFEMPVEEGIKPKKEPKKKREISEAQRQALAKGRARVKANREAKKKAEEAEKKKQAKLEREAVKKAKEEAKTQKLQKKKQLTEQEEIKKNKMEKEEGMIADFHKLKEKHFSGLKNFEAVDKMLNSYITRDDILKGSDHLQNKVGFLVMSADKKFLNKK